MIGMMTWTPPAGGVRQKSVVLETRALLHLRVAWASVARGPRTPEALVRRRVLTAAKRLRKAGVTRLVVPEAFAYGEQLEKVGVAPVSTLPLRRALAADLARAVMAGRNLSGGSARLAVAGDQLSGELVRTVTELALGNRYVLLDVPYGGDTLANQLRREYGVSLLLSPTRQQMEEADVLVLFAARTDLRRRDPAVLRLYDEAAPLPPLLLPPVLEGGRCPRASAALSCWPYWWRAASCGRGRSPWARRRADTAENFAKPQAASLDILKSTHYNTTL